MDIIQYKCYLRDAFIYNLSQTEEGIEYLENAWRLQQTTPERDKLRKKYGEDKN